MDKEWTRQGISLDLRGLKRGFTCIKQISFTKINMNVLSEYTLTLHGSTLLPLVRRS